MTGRFDIARALAARGGGDAPLSRNSIEHRSLEDLLSQQPTGSSRLRRDPDAQQFQQPPRTKWSNQKTTKKQDKDDDDDDGDNPLPNLEVDQLLDLLSVVGTGVLEGHQAGSIKLKKPPLPKRIKQTRAIDAPTETGEELQSIIKRLEQKKATAVTKEKIVSALLAGGPDAELPSPEQVAKLLEEATSTAFSAPTAAPVSPGDIVKKLVGGEKTLKLPKISDTPDMKLLKDVVFRQQGELEKLRAMVKQALDHTDQMREVHMEHSSKQEQEIMRLKKLLQEQREKPPPKQESLAEQLRRKFAASKNPTRSPSRRSGRHGDTSERPPPHKESRSSLLKQIAVASPTEQPLLRRYWMESGRGPLQSPRIKTMAEEEEKEKIEQEGRQGKGRDFEMEVVPDISQRRGVEVNPSAVPSGANDVIDLCGNDDNDGVTDAEEESDPGASEDLIQEKDVEMDKEPSNEMDSDVTDLEGPKQGTAPEMAVMDAEPHKIEAPSEGMCPAMEKESTHVQESIEVSKKAVEEATMKEPKEMLETLTEESLNEEHVCIHKNKVPVFIRQLHEALEQLETEGRDDIASFVDGGKAFNIHKPDKFAEHVMPRFFPTISYQSFHRQLNSYEFQCMTGGIDAGAYFHDNFIKGDFAKAAMIKRNVRMGLLSQKSKERSVKESQVSPEDTMLKSVTLLSSSTSFGMKIMKASQVLQEQHLPDSKSSPPPPKSEEETGEKPPQKDQVGLAKGAEPVVRVSDFLHAPQKFPPSPAVSVTFL